MLSYDPKDRPSAPKALESRYLEQYQQSRRLCHGANTKTSDQLSLKDLCDRTSYKRYRLSCDPGINDIPMNEFLFEEKKLSVDDLRQYLLEEGKSIYFNISRFE